MKSFGQCIVDSTNLTRTLSCLFPVSMIQDFSKDLQNKFLLVKLTWVLADVHVYTVSVGRREVRGVGGGVSGGCVLGRGGVGRWSLVMKAFDSQNGHNV